MNGQIFTEVNPPDLIFDSTGELIITAPASSSKHDFDFLVGSHIIHQRALKDRLRGSQDWREYDGTSKSTALLDGTVNQEIYQLINSTGKSYEGMALRLFNPLTKLWSIYWIQSDVGMLGDPPEVGYFENAVGFFFSQGMFTGKNITTVFKWDAREKSKPIWSQAFSEDNGKTWEWNWYMYYSR